MVTTSKTLSIRYSADTSGVKKGVGDIDRMNAGLGSKLKSVGQSMTSVGKTATLGLTLPIVAFGAKAISSFSEAQAAANQTAAVLKSTGGAAGVTESDIGKLSDRIGKLAAVDNDAIRAGENMLLTFTNIRNEAGKGNDVFNQASMTLADMSAAMGTDTKSSAIQLGKALNDPTKGITALTRVGVTFTDEQQKQIAAMQKAGNTAGAQKVILAELNKEFGGSAAAAGKAASPMVKMGLVVDDLGESVGEILVPMLATATKWVQKAATWFGNLSPGAKELAVHIALVAAAIGPMLIIGGKLVSAIGSIVNGFKLLKEAMTAFQIASKIAFLANPWFLLAAAIVVVAVLIITHWDTVKKFLLAAWDAIKAGAMVVWNAIKDVAGVVAAIVVGYVKIWLAVFKAVFGAIKAIALGVWHAITAYVKAWWTVTSAVFHVAKAVVIGVWNAIKKAAQTVWHWIATYIKIQVAIVKAIGAALRAFFSAVWTAIKKAAFAAWNAITGFIKRVWSGWQNIGRAIASFFGNIWDKVKSAGQHAWEAIKSAAMSAWAGIVSAGKGALNGMIGLVNQLINGVNTLIGGFNKLPGPDIGSIPTIPYLARGGRILTGGMAVVGERGPELVSLPAGATVSPNGSSAGASVTISLDRRRFGRGMELDLLTRGY